MPEIQQLVCNITSFDTNTAAAAAKNCGENPAGKWHICIDSDLLRKELKTCHSLLAVIESTDF